MFNESQFFEYKESWKDEYLKWICGFANAEGGKIYIGVSDDKKIVGVQNAKRLMEDIPNKIVCHLGIVADVNLHTHEDLEYIEIVISPSNMPISYKGQFHYRSGSTKQELKGLALQQFVMKKMGQSWDDIPLEYATIDDIDRDSVDYFIRKSVEAGRMDEDEKSVSTKHILENLGLICTNGKLKSAAILLFGKNVRKYFPAVEFKIGRFHSSESDLITQDVIDGNIIQMADRVIKILRAKYLISPIRYEGMQRIEELEIPEKALREIIYNSIAHKDYTGPSIQMRVYDNKVEIWNYGMLPNEITPEILMQTHSSYPRNKNVAHTFFKAGFIESWGRGFKKIREELDRVSMPMPEVKEDCGGILAILKRFTIEEIISKRGECGDKSYNDITTNVGSYVGSYVDKLPEAELTKRQQVICMMIKDNPFVSAKEMSETLSVVQRTIERDLAILQKLKLIRHEGNTNAGVWVILE